MRLPAEPYFSDAEIALETRPWVSGPDSLSKTSLPVRAWVLRMLGAALALSAALAVAACWLDHLG